MLKKITSQSIKHLLVGATGATIVAAAAAGGYCYYQSIKSKDSLKKDNLVPNNTKFLTQGLAEKRKNQITGYINYDLTLNVKKGTEFTGILIIEFNCKAEHDIFLDYEGKEINEIKINNNSDLSSQLSKLWDGSFMRIPQEQLNKGLNTISIRFTNKYVNDGNGFHSFIDTDQKQYIYSNCEPDHLHKIFPSFDQPDLKGYFSLKVIAPSEWTCISNSLVKQSIKYEQQGWLYTNDNIQKINLKQFLDDIQGENTAWEFNKTKPLSTYLYAIIAGPYKKLDIPKEKMHKNIPMAIYCREALFPYLEEQAIQVFDTTVKCMAYYENFFKTDYPFEKYDHIFCPEYNVGAMENAGAITVNDEYLFKDKVNQKTISWRAGCITHELSHMWFGDLVTMKWWNDLWLNESFAECFNSYSLMNVNLVFETTDAKRMNNLGKSWGYRTDQLAITHPIACQVRDTQEAETIFDGITYSKGAAVIYQLLKLVGDENFSKAMQKYFSTFQFSNATFSDFINIMDVEFKKSNPQFDLQEWQKQWIKSAGLNECEPEFDPSKNSSNEVLKINQRPVLKEHPTLRNHKMKVGFFNESGDATSYDIILKSKEQTLLAYDGTQRFKGVLLNYQDESFIKVILDPESLLFFKQNLYKIKDGLSRTMIWRCFFDMIRDCKMTILEYVDCVLNNCQHEKDQSIFDDMLSYARAALAQYVPNSEKDEICTKLFNVIYAILIKLPENSDSNFITSLQESLLTFSRTYEDVNKLYFWFLKKNDDLKRYEVGVYQGWGIVTRVYKSKKYSLEEKKQLFELQSARDKDSSNEMAKMYEAILADEKTKEQLWKSYLDPENKESLKLIEGSMNGFNLYENFEKKYGDLYFENLIQVYKKRSTEYSRTFGDALFPKCEDFNYLYQQIDNLIKKLEPSMIALKKFLDEEKDDLQRKERTFNYYFTKHPEKKK